MVALPFSVTHQVGEVCILPAKPGDVPALAALVTTVGLPTAGLEDAVEYFWVTRAYTTIVGSVGLEVYDDEALLRSLAVAPSHRGIGIGRILLDTVLAYLMARQFRRVYLLTVTATALFARYGFHSIPRTSVSVAVQQSAEFHSACPETATCMAYIFPSVAAAPSTAQPLRTARFDDMPAIQAIRNASIADHIATLDTEPHTAEDTQRWFHQYGPRHPILVANINGTLAGWASLNTFNARRAYQYVADLSVYIVRPWRGQGIGTLLLQAIIQLARQLEYHKIVLSAFPFNTAGMRLYERHGFRVVGIYKEMGWVDDQCVDTIIMEKLLHNG